MNHEFANLGTYIILFSFMLGGLFEYLKQDGFTQFLYAESKYWPLIECWKIVNLDIYAKF